MIKVILIEYRFQTHSAHLVYFFSGKIVPEEDNLSSFQSHQATRKLKAGLESVSGAEGHRFPLLHFEGLPMP